MTDSLFLETESFYLDLVNADSRLYPQLFADSAQAWFDCLRSELAWRGESIQLFGKKQQVPRLTAFYGEPDIRYSYSRIVLHARSWHPLLLTIRSRLQHVLGLSFNSVLANYYRDGSDYMGWHSDDEPELRDKPAIASLSLGAERPFYLRHRGKAFAPYHLSLLPGSLLLMGNTTQVNWQHSLPRRPAINAPRINLTFRCIEPCR